MKKSTLLVMATMMTLARAHCPDLPRVDKPGGNRHQRRSAEMLRKAQEKRDRKNAARLARKSG